MRVGHLVFECDWMTDWIDEWLRSCEWEWVTQSLKSREWTSDWCWVKEGLSEIASESWRSERWWWMKTKWKSKGVNMLVSDWVKYWKIVSVWVNESVWVLLGVSGRVTDRQRMSVFERERERERKVERNMWVNYNEWGS